jgi:class 3 adenylate cyclase
MSGLFIHAVVYVAVNLVLVFVWTVVSGSPDQLGDIAGDPSLALDSSPTFWPIYVMVPWGAGLLIHAAAALVGFLSPARRRARREEKRREMQRRRMERRIQRGKARGEELVSKTANAALEGVTSAVGSLVNRKDEQPPAGTRWVAVMFTDIADSTGLAERLGDDGWGEILRSHRQLVRTKVDDCAGTEIGTQGDGFLVRFDGPGDAVDAAVAIQQAAAADGDHPDIRIGIHVGDTLHDDDGDLIGQVVNLAARVTGAAEPSQILVTEPVADRLGPGVKLEDCGLVDLRGVSRARHLLEVVWR